VEQEGAQAYLWLLSGSRPTIARDNQRASADLFGATCAVGAALIMSTVSIGVMNKRLKESRAQVIAPCAQPVLK